MELPEVDVRQSPRVTSTFQSEEDHVTYLHVWNGFYSLDKTLKQFGLHPQRATARDVCGLTVLTLPLLGDRHEYHFFDPARNFPRHKNIADDLPRTTCDRARVALGHDEVRWRRKPHATVKFFIDGLHVFMGFLSERRGICGMVLLLT